MEIWLDMINLELIKKISNLIPIKGVTTNPSILSQTQIKLEALIEHILAAQNGLLAIQVVASDFDHIVQQAEKISAINRKRIVIKIPVTMDGIKAISFLEKKNVLTLATAIFEVRQLLLAVQTKTQYAAPYLSRISDNPAIAYATIKEMLEIIAANQSDSATKLMAAAIKTNEQVITCAKLGVQAITINEAVCESLFADLNKTNESMLDFERNWKANPLCEKALLFT